MVRTLALAGTILALGCQPAEQPAPPPTGTPVAPPSFVGSATCATCHPKETDAFRGSDHARAMQPASDQTVLGDFDQARITHRGVTSTFFRRAGKFLVRTDGPDGQLGEFEVGYTFGVDPLQQYLVPFPDGRLQALGLAWDSRPRSHGGQRWFPLYPAVTLRPPDPLHWTGREQTWNFQCAECHSTDLRKRYDLTTTRYATTWAELTVSCEECHGPGSAHAAWAAVRPAGASRAAPGSTGLVVRLGRGDGTWAMTDSGTAGWTGPPRTSAEIDVCARCHSRRRSIMDPHPYGQPFLDTHVPALLEPGLYHADGQILGEVYEWGSFVQSQMQRAGVTCSDCHEPHRATLRVAGNPVCAQCHLPAKFETPAHHHHRPESDAARCVSCHMPARTYMVVDPRRDHSFRVPRPDLSVALGTPNACTGCHRNRPPRWAADRIAAWGGTRRGTADFARALDAARRGLPEAGPAVTALAIDQRQPAIARATALAHFPEFSTAAMVPAMESGLRDGDALVRMAALRATEALPPERRGSLAAPLLRDPVRAVRLAAVQALAGPPRVALAKGQRADLDRAVAELVQSELVNADRPESHLNLANLYARLGRPADAESELRTALRLAPSFVPALLNLADLRRTQGRDADGERFLQQALRAAPDHAEALHALGLLRVRQNRLPEAVDLLRRAARAGSDSPRLAYVYAVALHDTGRAGDAVRILEVAHRRHQADRDILAALATYLGERGDVKRALGYAEKLAALDPADAAARTLLEALRRRAGAG